MHDTVVGTTREGDMQLAFRDIAALAKARRTGTTLDSQTKKDPKKATEPNVASALEALRAVLPATLITLYSTAVILLQNVTNAAGASERAAEQAALATTHGAGTPALTKALEALSVEPTTFAWARVAFAVIWIAFVGLYAFRTAQGVPGRRVILEPLVATAAFVAWALASPGTFLASYLNASNLAVVTILIAFVGAGGLLVLSDGVLKNQVKDPT